MINFDDADRPLVPLERRLMAGIAAVGSGVAAVILPNVTVALIGTYSLSAAFLFESAPRACPQGARLPASAQLPRDLGLEPYGRPRGRRRASPGRARAARRNRNVPEKLAPLVLVAMTFVSLHLRRRHELSGRAVHLRRLLRRGAAALVALCGGCLTVAKLASGVVFDRDWDEARLDVLFRPVHRWHVAALPVDGNVGLAGVSVFLCGLGLSLGTVGISVWSIELSAEGL